MTRRGISPSCQVQGPHWRKVCLPSPDCVQSSQCPHRSWPRWCNQSSAWTAHISQTAGPREGTEDAWKRTLFTICINISDFFYNRVCPLKCIRCLLIWSTVIRWHLSHSPSQITNTVETSQRSRLSRSNRPLQEQVHALAHRPQEWVTFCLCALVAYYKIHWQLRARLLSMHYCVEIKYIRY